MTSTTFLNPTALGPWLSSREAAEFLGVTQLTIQRWTAARLFPVYRYARHFRFKVADLTRFAENHRRDARDSHRYASTQDPR